MKLNLIIKLFFFIVFFFGFANLVSPGNAYAQYCSIQTCSTSSDCRDCGTINGNSYSCLSGTCCVCICGWSGSTEDVGPVYCSDRNATYNVGGCFPCPPIATATPTTAVTPTTAPPTCCQGRLSSNNPSYCPTISDYNSCLGAYNCTWTCDGVWLCKYPGHPVGNLRCEQENIMCPNPDIPGGLCFTTQRNCIDNCSINPTSTINPRRSLETLCSYRTGRFGIVTAIGCFPSDDTNEMLVFILRWSIGVAGGISFLLIVYGGFLIMGSGANAEKVKAGKELLTAAITGIILLIFSVFILDFFGLRILRISGL